MLTRRPGAAAIALLVTVSAVATVGAAPARGATRWVIELAGAATQFENTYVRGIAVSEDGRYVAFASQDAEDRPIVAFYDRDSGSTLLLARGASRPDISSTGRYLTFSAIGMEGSETRSDEDVFVLDRDSGGLDLVTYPDDATGTSPAISSNGRYVAFETDYRYVANDDEREVVPGSSASAPDIYVRDRNTGAIEWISEWFGPGFSGIGWAHSPAISGDARWVAWLSDHCVEDPGGRCNTLFLYDRRNDKGIEITRGYGSVESRPSLSFDGRYVAYQDAMHSQEYEDGFSFVVDGVWVYDRKLNRRENVLYKSETTNHWLTADNSSYAPAISDDGRSVAFASDATNIVRNDTNGARDVFVHDRTTRVIERVSLGVAGEANGDSVPGFLTDRELAISGGGRTIAFTSAASNLTSGDTGPGIDVFVAAPNVTCPAPEELPEFDLTRRERKEVSEDMRGNVSLDVYIERLERAIEIVEADTRENPEHAEQNQAALDDLEQRLAEARAEQQRSPAQRRVTALTDNQSSTLDQARCALLEEAQQKLEAYLSQPEIGHGDKVALWKKLITLRDLLKQLAKEDGGYVGTEEKQQLLKENITDLIARLAFKEEETHEAVARKQATYKKMIDAVYDVIDDHLIVPDPSKSIIDRWEKQIRAAASILGGDEEQELVDHVLTLRKVLMGTATREEQFAILKDSVANLASRLTTRIFGTNLLGTPQARAAVLGFQLGTAFGERIAADLELIFQGILVSDCTEAFRLDQGVSGPGSVDYTKPTNVVVTNETFHWHAGWRCVIHQEGSVPTAAGGVVIATRPETAPFYLRGMWLATTNGGKKVISYDPACAFQRECTFKKGV